MPDPVQNPSVPTPPPSLAQQSTAPAPPQVQNPAGVPDQIPNPPPQLQNMQQLPKQYQPTVPTGGGHWHQAVQALLGTSTQYRPSDPNNPNSPPVPYQVQNKPGNLFRSILAGAILGAGAGTSNAEHNAGPDGALPEREPLRCRRTHRCSSNRDSNRPSSSLRIRDK